ncbi:MAG: glycosyltransferase family 4 protein [Armatimonadetes bacterium]|nr:glycosyltransferase family 4 protein [Armatimonadota bacterium]
MIKVCHLSTVHQPFDVRIFLKECRTLASAGYDTHLVVTHDGDTERDGVRIHGLPRPRDRWDRLLRASRRCLSKAIEVDADLYHFHDPELIRVGLALKRRGKKVVYDVHESHAESVLDRAYIPGPLRRLVSSRVAAAEQAADRSLDAVVAATPKIARAFSNPETVLVQNYPLLEELAPAGGRPFAERAPQAVYVGGLSLVRGAKEMAEALKHAPGLDLAIVGEPSGGLTNDAWLSNEVAPRVKTLGWKSRADVAALMSESRAGLVVYHPIRNHVESQPNKLFEYMAAGLPVVASDFPHWRDIVEREGCGVLVDPLDPAAIGSALMMLVSDPGRAQDAGQRGRTAVLERYNWTIESEKLLDLYRRLLD